MDEGWGRGWGGGARGGEWRERGDHGGGGVGQGVIWEGVQGRSLAELFSSTVSLIDERVGHIDPYHVSGVCGGHKWRDVSLMKK